jgi:hypothetical protein
MNESISDSFNLNSVIGCDLHMGINCSHSQVLSQAVKLIIHCLEAFAKSGLSQGPCSRLSL